MKKLILTLIYLLPLSVMGQYPQVQNVDNQIIIHDGFVLSYNESCEQANWVYYKLTSSDIIGDNPTKRKNSFRSDPLVKTGSASKKDYYKSGYDRGHLKPAGDERLDPIQMNETFVMSNMSPQTSSFNRGIWRRLENKVRGEVVIFDSIIVITGPILNDTLPTIGNGICVPERFFKVLYKYMDGECIIDCYLIPNKKSNDALNRFGMELETLENKTNLKF